MKLRYGVFSDNVFFPMADKNYYKLIKKNCWTIGFRTKDKNEQ